MEKEDTGPSIGSAEKWDTTEFHIADTEIEKLAKDLVKWWDAKQLLKEDEGKTMP